MPLLCLEGVDGSGKSTLAGQLESELKSDLDVVQLHRGPLHGDPLQEYALSVASSATHRTIICDRWHWGELVYGPIYRGESKIDTAKFRWLELWMLAHGTQVYHVTQPESVILSRLRSRGEDFIDLSDVSRISSGFTAVASRSPLYGGDLSPEGDTSELVKSVGQSFRYHASRPNEITARYKSFIGDPLPRALLVGDTPGGGGDADNRAFLPGSGNSGEYLLTALPETFWPTVAIANSACESGRLGELVDDLYQPAVIALGQAAHQRLDEEGVPHAGVPHPQWVRRFKHSDRERYGQLIVEVSRTGEQRFQWPH